MPDGRIFSSMLDDDRLFPEHRGEGHDSLDPDVSVEELHFPEESFGRPD